MAHCVLLAVGRKGFFGFMWYVLTSLVSMIVSIISMTMFLVRYRDACPVGTCV